MCPRGRYSRRPPRPGSFSPSRSQSRLDLKRSGKGERDVDLGRGVGRARLQEQDARRPGLRSAAPRARSRPSPHRRSRSQPANRARVAQPSGAGPCVRLPPVARRRRRALLDRLRAGRGALRPRVEPLRPRRPLRPGGARRVQGIGLWHADLEHVLETRTLADVKALLDDHGLESPRARVPLGVVPRPGRRAPPRRRAGPARSCRCRRRARRAPRQGREHPGHAVRAAAADRGLRRALRRRGRAPRREARLRVHAARRQRPRPRDGARARRGRRRAERRRSRSTPGTWRSSGSRPTSCAAIPAAPARLGRALRRPVREHGRPGRRDDQPPQAARRGRVPDPRVRRRRAARPATPARGASRSSRRRSGASRSSRSSTSAYATTPRPAHSADPHDLRRPIRRAHDLDVRHGADHRPDLRLHVAARPSASPCRRPPRPRRTSPRCPGSACSASSTASVSILPSFAL